MAGQAMSQKLTEEDGVPLPLSGANLKELPHRLLTSKQEETLWLSWMRGVSRLLPSQPRKTTQ